MTLLENQKQSLQSAIKNLQLNPQSALTGIVVNHTHWDREWYMPFQRYRTLLVDTVDNLLDILQNQPDYGSFLLDGQTAVAEDYLEVRPERRAELMAHIRRERIGLGPWYVLPDEFIPSGESLIRNLLLGRQQMQALGAPAAHVGYLPDTFGHPAQLPQILAGFDLNSMVIYRGVKIDVSEFSWQAPDGTQLLTIYLPGGYFNAMELARAPHFWLDAKLNNALEQLARFATTDVVLLMNGSDHLEAQAATQAFIDEANRRQDRVHLRQGTLAEYVQMVRQAKPELQVQQGEWRHNRPARITPGVISTRMYLKQADFRAAMLLERGAEPLQALAWRLGAKHDSGLLATAWRYLLQNHPHDSICGCSIDDVHRDGAARYRWAQEIGSDLVERATKKISNLVAVGQGSAVGQIATTPGFAVFNTLATAREVVVRQRLHFLEPGVQFELLDAQNQPVAYQEIRRQPIKIMWDPQRQHFHCEGWTQPLTVVSPLEMRETGGRWKRWEGEEVEILFRAALPAGGYAAFGVVSNPLSLVASQNHKPELRTQSSVLSSQPLELPIVNRQSSIENSLLRVEVAPDGSFSLLDKTTGRSYAPLNVFRSEADRGDEYSFCPAEEDKPVYSLGGQASCELVENGAARQTLEVRLNLQVPAQLAENRQQRTGNTVSLPICSRISLSAGQRRVEIETTLENTARDHRLRVMFASGVQTEFADAQGQFQVMRRPVELAAEERARVPLFDEEQEVSYHPHRNFVDVSDERGGLAMLNRGLPEYEAEAGSDGVWLGLTLLRAVGWLSRDDLSTRYKHAGPPIETPDAQCLGQHTFEYAVVPHAGDWLGGGIPQEAEGYVTPVHSTAIIIASNTDEHSYTPMNTDENSNNLRASVSSAVNSFYRLSPDEVVFSALKRSDDGQNLTLRGYNIAPYPVEATLQLGFAATVYPANLAERITSAALTADPAAPGNYRFSLRPHEIFTFAIISGQEEVESRRSKVEGQEQSSIVNRQSSIEVVMDNLRGSAEVKLRAIEMLAEPTAQAAKRIVEAMKNGHKVMICGNGGSAGDAQHFAGEIVGRYKVHGRAALPAFALTTDSTVLTCVANDFSYEEVFSRQVEAFAQPGDVLIAISTSGRSPNVIRAVEAAKTRGATTIALTGGTGGTLAQAADLALVAPSSDTARIQECHITLIHAICEIVDQEFMD